MLDGPIGAEIRMRLLAGSRPLPHGANPLCAPLGCKGDAFATGELIDAGLELGPELLQPRVLFQ
jgi:hypothetical protein